MRRNLKQAVALLATVAAGLAVVFIAGPKVIGAATPHLYAGTVLQQSTPAPSLSDLRFADGSSVELAEFEDDVVLVYFGYASCPDVCPTALALVSQALDDLSPAEAERVQLVMVTVDPQRDEAAELDEYVQFFHPSFMGAAGDLEATAEVATRYGIFYEIGDPADPSKPDEYFVDHTSTLMAVGPDGALRVVWSPTVTADEVSADVKELLKQ